MWIFDQDNFLTKKPMAETEIWKDIPWYEWIYQANDKWAVRKGGKMMSQHFLKGWYLWLALRNTSCKRTHIATHRIIAKTYLWTPDSKMQVNHKNWIKTDNRPENLEWVSPAENTRHAWKTGLIKKNKYHRIWQYTKSWTLIKIWEFCMDIQRELWISNSHINNVCQWKWPRSYAGWFIWKFITD